MIASANQPIQFQGRLAVIATMHCKERVIGPILEAALAIKTLVPPNLDTDRFGTFTREVDRAGAQLEAARRKALAAIELTNISLGIASEGSFGPHPILPGVAYNQELVVLVDREHGLELTGEHRTTQTNYRHCTIRDLAEAEKFAQAVGFPSHGIVVMASPKADPPIFKGITTIEGLTHAVPQALNQSPTATIHLEADMRALYNPTRMAAIAEATRDLARKLSQRCPACQWPGFDMGERVPGLPCALCNAPTELTLLGRSRCQYCGFTLDHPYPDGLRTADPTYCAYCNP